jgi:hypothetical protein
MATLGTARVTKVSPSLSVLGGWRAEVWLESGATAPLGKQDLTIGDLILKGTAVRGGVDAPDSPHVIHIGGAGWETPITTPLSYGPQSSGSSQPVRLSTVLADLSRRAGETIEQPADRTIGPTWAFAAAKDGEPLLLKDALQALYRDGFVGAWRVDPDGVTRFGPRILGPVTARATPLKRDSGIGWALLGIDSPRAFLPGGTWEGKTILRTDIEERPGALTCGVFLEKLSVFRNIERRMATRFPALTWGFPRTYVVAAVRGNKTLDLRPPADSPHLPSLAAVEQWLPGGMAVVPKVGARCLVAFRDARSGTPAVVGYEPGGVPDEVDWDADAVKLGRADGTVVREGDTISIAGPSPASGIVSITLGQGSPVAVSKVKA